jgi:hypothetical protein
LIHLNVFWKLPKRIQIKWTLWIRSLHYGEFHNTSGIAIYGTSDLSYAIYAQTGNADSYAGYFNGGIFR